MAALRDAAKLAEQLQERAGDLGKQLADGRGDFAELTRLADSIGAESDALADVLREMDEALGRLRGDAQGDGGESLTEALSTTPRSGAGSSDESGRDELLARAQEVGLSGPVGWMSNETLQEAIDAEDAPTKAELLERAKKADIPGRSEMSKDELAEALRSHGG